MPEVVDKPKDVAARPLRTVPQQAKLFGVHDQTIYREIRRGHLRAVKVAGAWRIRPVDADAYLAGER